MNTTLRSALIGCASLMVLGAATTPSQAEQQVFKFFVNKAPPGGTGSGSSFVGPGCDKNSGGLPGCGTFNTTSSAAGAMSEASSIGIGTQGHAVVSTLNDAFDGYGELQGGTTGGGGSPNAPTVSYGGLTVTRQVETTLGNPDSDNPLGTTIISAPFTAAGVPNAERSIETFTNNTATTIDTVVSYSNNLGSDSNTKFVTIGANNTFVASQQLTVGNLSSTSDPTITQVLGNNAYTASNVTAYVADGDDNPVYAYHLVVAPGQTVILATFVILTGDINRGDGVDANSNGIEDAVESDIALGDTLAQLILNNPNLFLSDLTALQLSEIINFNLCTTIDTSQASFDETSCAAQANPMEFNGGTLKPTTTTTFNQAVTVDATNGFVDNTNGDITFNGIISGPGGLTFEGTHTTFLNNTEAYTGPTILTGGKLEIDGSIATSALTVNGGTLQGTGTVGTTVVNSGGTISPGTAATPNATLTVTGNLTLNTGSTYAASVSSAGHDLIAVSGTAALHGTVAATAGANTFSIGQSITILTAGTVTGTFSGITSSGFNAAMRPTLAYTGTTVSLVLAPNALVPTLGAGTTLNELRVAGAVDFAVAHDNALAFGPLYALTGSGQQVALDGLSGEIHAEFAQSGFAMGNAFVNMMLNPYLDARGGVAGASGPSLAYAPLATDGSQVSLSLSRGGRRIAPGTRLLDNAGNNDGGPANPLPASASGGPVGVWVAGFGERDSALGGGPVGSHQVGSNEIGVAGGIDLRPSDNTVFGLAAAFGHTGSSIADLMSNSKANVTQGGAYGATRFDSLYLSAAFSYSSYDVKTARTLILGGTNRYAASFTASGYGGRVELGDQMWQSGTSTVSPYVSVNVQTFDAPAYSEATLAGSSAFATTTAAQTSTDVASELGFKIDTSTGTSNSTVLHATLAWAHDFTPSRHSTIAFSSFAGSSFIVNGAPEPADAALVGIGLNTRLFHGLSLGLLIDGKFAGDGTSIGGSAALSYRW